MARGSGFSGISVARGLVFHNRKENREIVVSASYLVLVFWFRSPIPNETLPAVLVISFIRRAAPGAALCSAVALLDVAFGHAQQFILAKLHESSDPRTACIGRRVPTSQHKTWLWAAVWRRSNDGAC